MTRRLRETARPAVHWARQQLLRGDRYECPCCGYRARRFRSYGARHRPNEMCPSCRSLKRHRWQWLVLRDHLALEDQAGTLLHVAPEGVLAPKLRAAQFIRNIGLDLNSSRPIDVQADLMRLPFKNESVDYVLCSHVLEHVSDDVAAMTEIHRVLRNRGWALIGVPVRLGKPTLEDVNVTTPDERQRLFGHPEHVRYYGRDLITRLESAGFDVTLIRAQSLGPVEAKRYLCEGAVVFICRRGDAVPERKESGLR